MLIYLASFKSTVKDLTNREFNKSYKIIDVIASMKDEIKKYNIFYNFARFSCTCSFTHLRTV